jgi:hypothetical protein
MSAPAPNARLSWEERQGESEETAEKSFSGTVAFPLLDIYLLLDFPDIIKLISMHTR